jgi:transcriptional regulator with XRE-family HTH domain
MKERLLQLLNYLGLTATRFADEIGVQRSGISHILSGRNQPSYDFLVKTLHKFPEIDIEWLITGHGEIIKQSTGTNNSYVKEIHVLPETTTTGKKTNQITNVNNVVKIIVLYNNGTFNHYDPAKED